MEGTVVPAYSPAVWVFLSTKNLYKAVTPVAMVFLRQKGMNLTRGVPRTHTPCSSQYRSNGIARRLEPNADVQTSVYAQSSYVMALQRATVCEELGWL